MVVLFSVAWFAQLAGAEPIIGAFLAGLTLNRLIPLNSPLMTRVRFIGNALFIPFFLLSVGMLVDPRVLFQSTEVWILAGLLIGLVHLGKFAGAWATKMAFGYSKDEGLAMFGLSSPQAAATLAVTFVGLEIGLFGEAVVNAVIVMIVVTVFVGPWFVERYGRAIALQEERRPYDPREAPRRILIPIANPATADALLDIAFLLRDKNSPEPIFPLTVVRGSGDDPEARVAEAEKMLSHAVLYAAGADVPVSPLTRVDPNIATGMVRAVTETRTSIVVVGWDGRSSASRTAVFGTVLDQLLEQTRQTVIVARMGHPLNTTGRMVLVLPPEADRHPGFAGAAGLIKRLAAEVDARLEIVTVGGDPGLYDGILRKVPPEHPFTLTEVEGWGPLLWDLRERLGPQDLVAVLSTRRGTLGWSRELERLPGQLASLVPETFLMVYPAESIGESPTDPLEEPAIAVDADLTHLPASMDPQRIVLELPVGQDYRQALRILLQTHFKEEQRIDQIVNRLCSGEEAFSSEVRNGIALPHAMLTDLDEPLMFLGLSREGLSFPNIPNAVHAVFVLLGSSGKSIGHLRLLTGTARILREAGTIETLTHAKDVAAVAAWFANQPQASP
jgi:mannitol/fructose-specific phosphotransferase system IIA component (Ntr-type)/nucleotide-binding universal stress UspA family protein